MMDMVSSCESIMVHDSKPSIGDHGVAHKLLVLIEKVGNEFLSENHATRPS